MATLFKDLGNPTLHLDTKQHRVKALEQCQLLLEAKKTATNVQWGSRIDRYRRSHDNGLPNFYLDEKL